MTFCYGEAYVIVKVFDAIYANKCCTTTFDVSIRMLLSLFALILCSRRERLKAFSLRLLFIR